MFIDTYQNIDPIVGDNTYIAPTANLIGKVKLGSNVSVWHNAVLRGDIDDIIVGDNSNIQDLCTLHSSYQRPTIVGKNCTIGHNVILHACTIGEGTLIGMGAIILDGAEIGKNCLVAAGSIVPPRKIYPPGSFIIGSPAIVKRSLSDEEILDCDTHYKHYFPLKDAYLKKD